MIKDTNLKIKAIRYCVALGYVPHMEVVVRFAGDTSDSPSDLTDIDVLGIKPGTDLGPLRIIFDCKTLGKISPINRAFWAKGLMAVTHSVESFVILTKPAIEGHRLAGNSFGVHLYSEQLFDSFATSASSDYLVPCSYLENIDAWSELFRMKAGFPKIEDLLTHLNSTALLQLSGNAGIRSLVSQMRQVSGELDPAKSGHRAVFLIALAQFSIFVSDIARDFHNIFDPAYDKAKFEQTLRYYIWGGKENYDIRQRLSVAIKENRGVSDSQPFDFPAWERFVDFFRTCLDSPLSTSAMCLPIKDMAFRELTTATKGIDQRLGQRLNANNRIRQFALAAASYLSEACRLPREFRDTFTADLNALMTDKKT